MHKAIAAPFLALLVLFAAACSTSPETPRENLAAVEVTFQAAMQTAQDIYRTGKMDQETANRVAAAIVAVDAGLDAWRLNPDVADSQSTAISALRALQAILSQFGEQP